MAIYFSKVSGVVRVATDSDVPRIYFTPSGKCIPNPDGVNVTVQIQGDTFTIPYTDLRVNNQTPATMSTAITLLNSLFGS